MRQTLAKKVGLGIGLLLIIFSVFGFIIYLQTLTIEKNMEIIIQLEEPTSAAAYEMEINLVEIGVMLFSYLHDHNPLHLERINQDRKDFEGFQKIYQELADTEEEKELGVKIKQGYDEFIALAYELIRIEDEQTRKMGLLTRNLNKIDDILDDNIQALIKPDDPQQVQKIKSTFGMEINAYEIFSRMSEYLRVPSDLAEARIHKDEQDFRKYFEGYKNLKLSPEERQWTAQVGRLFEEKIRFVREIITMDKTQEKGLEKVVRMHEGLDDILDDEIQADTYADLDQAKASVIKSVKSSHVYGGIAFFLSLAAGVLGGVLITRGITRPLRELAEATGIVAKGDFTQRVEVKTRDETGQLAELFNRMLEELQKTTVSRDYVENILYSMGESLIVVSEDGKIEQVNPATCTVLGYREDELLGQSYQKVLIDEGLNIEIFTEISIDGKETVCLSKNNERIPVLLTVSAIKDMNGLITGYIFVAMDIAERKQMENDLLKSKAQFETLSESSPIGIFLDDAEGKCIYVNPKCAELIGLSPEECLGLKWVPFIHPDDRKRVTDEWARSVEQGIVFDLEYRWVHRDGKTIWTHGLVVPVKHLSRTSLFVGTLIDLTERKCYEEQIRRLNAELEQRVRERTAQLQAANKELEAFTYSVSHDLRAPLRAIDGFAEILLREYSTKLDDEGKRLCSIITGNAKKMGQLIDELLSLSRLGRIEMRSYSIDMKALANEVYLELTTPEMRRRIDFQLGDLSNALCDSALIRQVWMNLISNAIKFSSDRERAVISVTSSEEKGQIVYCVRDNGAGFNMKYRDKLFDVFQRLHSEKEFEGTGVGLAIVQRVVHRHGGKVWAEGETDKGAMFCFSIPIKEGNRQNI